MDRIKRIIFVSNCVLNQNVVVDSLARSKGAYVDIIKTIMNYGVGIHQLPCPEFRHLGLGRKPMTKEEYDSPDYRSLSKEISLDMLDVIKEYLYYNYNIIGLIGINGSPSCSINGEAGIMMESIKEIISENGIHLKTIDIPTNYYDGDKAVKFIEKLKMFIEENIK